MFGVDTHTTPTKYYVSLSQPRPTKRVIPSISTTDSVKTLKNIVSEEGQKVAFSQWLGKQEHPTENEVANYKFVSIQKHHCLIFSS